MSERYIRGMIRLASRPGTTWAAVLCSMVGIGACLAQPPAAAGVRHLPRDERINTTVFDCLRSGDGQSFEFTVRRGPGELALWLPLDFNRPYLVLSRDFDVADELYREADVSVTLFDDTADLGVGDERFPRCMADVARSVWEHAKLRGVDYRASGAAPDWSVELRRGGELVFRSTTEDLQVTAATPEPDSDPVRGSTVYRAEADGHRLTFEIDRDGCAPADGSTMRGSIAWVDWEGRRYMGCGRALH